MVDYKKWDKFVADLSSDEEEEQSRSRPRVRELSGERGGTVTIGPQGYRVHGEDLEEEEEEEDFFEDEEQHTHTHIHTHAHSQTHTQTHTQTSVDAKRFPVSDRVQVIDDVASSSAQSEPSTRNGGVGEYRGAQYRWSQDRYEASLSLYISLSPALSRAESTPWTKRNVFLLFHELQRKIVLVYSPKESRESVDKRLESLLAQSEESASSLSPLHILFVGDLQYAVELAGDPTNPFDELFEWQIVQQSESSLRVDVSLRKHCPIAGATLWWERVFLGEPKIDVTKIAGRTLQTQDALRTAEELFLKKIQGREKIEVDVGDDENEDER